MFKAQLGVDSQGNPISALDQELIIFNMIRSLRLDKLVEISIADWICRRLMTKRERNSRELARLHDRPFLQMSSL